METDFMSALEIELNFAAKTVHWNYLAIPMKEDPMLTNYWCEEIYFAQTKAPVL